MLLSLRRSTVTVAPRRMPVFWSGEFFSSLEVTRKLTRFFAVSTSLQAPAALVTLPASRYTRAPAGSVLSLAVSSTLPPVAVMVPLLTMVRPCTSMTPRNGV